MPNKNAVKPQRFWDPPMFKPGQLVNVFNFEAEHINLAPRECFHFADCKGCHGHEGRCTLAGPLVSKDDILTIVDCRPAIGVDEFQLVLLMTPDGALGALHNEMLAYVPETMPEKEKVK
jgi:hypothetical protein